MRTTRQRPAVILTAALTGAAYPANRYPQLPLSVRDVAKDAKRAYLAGARAIHYHARNPATSLQFADQGHYRKVRVVLDRLLPGVPISFASSRKGEVEVEIEKDLNRRNILNPAGRNTLENIVQAEMIRAGGIEALPDRFTTFTPPELLIAGDIAQTDYNLAVETYSELTRQSWKNPRAMKAYWQALTCRARSLGVSEELEITTWKALDVIERIADDPALTLPPQVSLVFLFGFSAHLPIEKRVYDDAIAWANGFGRRRGVTIHITVGAAIHPTFAHPGPERLSGREPLPAGKHDIRELVEWVSADPRVESFRVGLEDSPELYGRKPGNGDLVAHAREIFESLGVAIELDVVNVRRIFGLPPVYSTLLRVA